MIFHVTYYFIFMLYYFTTHRKPEQKYLVIISLYRSQGSEPQVGLWDQLIVVRVRLVYSWKYTGTITTNFYLVS